MIKFITLKDLLSQWLFSQFCNSSMLIWPFQLKKCHFRGSHLQSLNQKDTKHVTLLLQINFLDAHWSHCGDKVVTNNLFKSYFSF